MSTRHEFNLDTYLADYPFAAELPADQLETIAQLSAKLSNEYPASDTDDYSHATEFRLTGAVLVLTGDETKTSLRNAYYAASEEASRAYFKLQGARMADEYQRGAR